MSIHDNQNLYNVLSELGIIEKNALNQAYTLSETTHTSLGTVLLKKDLISDENLGRIVAENASLPYIRLSTIAIPREILEIVPEIVAKKNRVILFKKDGSGLHLAMANPENLEIVDFIKRKTGLPVKIYYATDSDVENALNLYLKDVNQAFNTIISENIHQASGEKSDPPIIKIVDTILTYAYQNKASDIHIEPYERHSLVRFRIDSILHDILTLSLDLHNRIVTRIKVLSKLRTDEHQAAQDGKFQFPAPQENVDVRVSIVPTSHGENAVMRLLTSGSRHLSLPDLGFIPDDLKKVQSACGKPFGMILSTGPTGSGKTTTMYAILKLLNKREINISTIEDPIEYEMEDITQIQVNPRTNLTFAEGLKSILRQDPNVILVGEIRDQETAGIAINAAMTGHLVLSTLHTNNAATTIPRLIEMNIEPFLIASTVNVIIAQRLMRRIHASCRISQEIPVGQMINEIGEAEFMKIFGSQILQKDGQEYVRVYRGKGCQLDHNTGYEGRIGIFEVLMVDDAIRQAISEKRDAAAIHKIAIGAGMKTMLADGLEKVKQGLTTIDEVIRVTREM